MYKTKAEKISRVIANYFEGIYKGDLEQLRQSFHSQAYLYGDIKGAEYLKSLDDYLDGVAKRKSPAELEEENRMQILSLEILGDVALAKLHVPIFGFNYYDYVSFAVVDGDWKIVNKVFTHVE